MSRLDEIVIEDLIDVLLGVKAERYTLEANIALSVFCSWLHYPTDQAILRHARTVTAANLYVTSKDPKREQIPYVDRLNLARALADPPIAGDFLSWFDDMHEQLEGLDDILNFFMRCPSNRSASLNRAFHFIEREGFLDTSDPNINELRKTTRGTASLKVIWKERAHTGPFVWAAGLLLRDILFVEPDAPGLLTTSNRILRNKAKLARYLGIAKWCQERLADRLDREARSKISFVRFPASLLSIDPKIPTFDAEQLKIADSYKAPQLRAKRKVK